MCGVDEITRIRFVLSPTRSAPSSDESLTVQFVESSGETMLDNYVQDLHDEQQTPGQDLGAMTATAPHPEPTPPTTTPRFARPWPTDCGTGRS